MIPIPRVLTTLAVLLITACGSDPAPLPAPRPAAPPPPPAAPAPVAPPAPVVTPVAPVVTAAPAVVPVARGETVRELSQYGITWTFAQPVQAGRFITGDWWVVGPVTVTQVSPAPAPGRNGSVVDPPAGDKQGYDNRASGFDASLTIAFPRELKPGQALVSTASVEKVGEKTPDTVGGQGLRGPLRTAVALTCVAEPPPADAFRPAYVGTWRENFRATALRRDLLPRLKPPKELPDPKGLERFLERIWLDHQREYVNRYMHPLENMPDYGREITNIVSNAAVAVLLDDPEGKMETVLLRYIQKGIDYYGAVQSDANLWVANGGHNSGRKWPIVFAGLMLGHDGMMHVKASFQEDQQTYYGPGFKGQKVLWSITPRSANAKHEESDPAGWKTFGKGDNNGTKAEAYRRLNGPTWVGQALAARLLGAQDLWNHPAYFDYVDRWIAEEGDKAASGLVDEMWKTYRTQADTLAAEAAKRQAAAAVPRP